MPGKLTAIGAAFDTVVELITFQVFNRFEENKIDQGLQLLTGLINSTILFTGKSGIKRMNEAAVIRD